MGQILKWRPAQSTDGRQRWREQKNIYNQRDLTKRRTAFSEDTRKFYWWSIRRGEEEFILRQGPRTDLDPLLNYAVDDPVPQWSCSTVDEVLTKSQFLNPLLYPIHCIGPVGFGFAHIYSERHPPNRDLAIYIYLYILFLNLIPHFPTLRCSSPKNKYQNSLAPCHRLKFFFPPLSSSLSLSIFLFHNKRDYESQAPLQPKSRSCWRLG